MRDNYRKDKGKASTKTFREVMFTKSITPALQWRGTDMLWPFSWDGRRRLARIKLADLFKIVEWDLVYEPPKEDRINVKFLEHIVDNGTTVVTIATPEGWKCPRENCPFDYMHSHGTYPSLTKKP